jgi:hypothetical protein
MVLLRYRMAVKYITVSATPLGTSGKTCLTGCRLWKALNKVIE